MQASISKVRVILSLLASGLTAASAAPVTYEIDPNHTYPSFEADHLGGLSTWRGKFNRSSGRIVLDTAARAGTVEVTIDMASVDFGHDEMNEHALSADIFDVARYPTAVFKGELTEFDDGKPGKAVGTLTLRGVTRPLTLEIEEFLCKPNPMTKREVCGADAEAEFRRSDFGIDYGAAFGFRQEVELQIQVEAIRAE